MTSLRRTVSQSTKPSSCTEICSTFGGKRVSPSLACVNGKGPAMWNPIKLWQWWENVGQRVGAAPSRIDALERRITALEVRPHLPMCESCGIGQRRLIRIDQGGAFGDGQIKVYRCDHCGFEM